MRNRRIMDECFAADGATVTPAIESDSVAGLVTGPDDPPSVLAGALLTVAREADVRQALDERLHTYLNGHGR
ncbi:hypothetical protein ACFWMG_20965 [Streptomyces sp. NPDC127074]|uniref:hypothetical protein n=1 Tax=Streptomyces sp. NPDC127074 TaxID=3347130 RepID=UPI0036564723